MGISKENKIFLLLLFLHVKLQKHDMDSDFKEVLVLKNMVIFPAPCVLC